MHPDKQFVWPQFTSTSTSDSAAFEGNIRFEIACNKHLKPGTNTQMYVPKSIQHLSEFQDEAEVLFPPHVHFRVVN
eukprot:352270-Amphidinium_carterae.1